MSARIRELLTLAIAILALTACASLHDWVPRPIQPEPVYDSLYPYYVEICAVSQIRAKFTDHGGSPGHAVMYLKGVCRNPSTPYPTLKVCDPDSIDLTDPEAGMGLSVNKLLKNANWIAIPGKRLFIEGNLDEGQVLDKAHALATIEHAANSGVFDGIEIHEQYAPPDADEEALLRLAAEETLATDFALRFGRTIWCSRLPVTRSMLEDIIAYLNGLNHEYATGDADYNWSGYSDNCSHTLHNALAAAGVWEHKTVGSFKLRQLFNLSVPANEFADLAILSTVFPIENFDRVYQDKTMRQTLMERNWLPTRHGALMKLIPMHQDNELYDTRVRIFVLENPILKPKSRRVTELISDWRTTGVAANLRYFRELYRKILDQKPADWDQVSPGDNYTEVRKRYYEYIENQLNDVNDKFGQLFPEQRQRLRQSGFRGNNVIMSTPGGG